MKLEHGEDGLRVRGHLRLADARHGQHGVPLARETREACRRAWVHLHMDVVLDVKGRADVHGVAAAAAAAVGVERRRPSRLTSPSPAAEAQRSQEAPSGLHGGCRCNVLRERCC